MRAVSAVQVPRIMLFLRSSGLSARHASLGSMPHNHRESRGTPSGMVAHCLPKRRLRPSLKRGCGSSACPGLTGVRKRPRRSCWSWMPRCCARRGLNILKFPLLPVVVGGTAKGAPSTALANVLTSAHARPGDRPKAQATISVFGTSRIWIPFRRNSHFSMTFSPRPGRPRRIWQRR